ncbi:MAG: fimbrial protein [Pseudomonadota bacterium]
MSDTLTANLGRGIFNTPLLRLKFPSIQILASSCSVSIPDPVNLEPIKEGDLPLVGQPHAAEELFNLELTGCDGSNARVNLKLEGTTEPGYPAVLKSTGGASGVGIQVLNKNDNSNPITFGDEVVVGNTGGASTYRIPLAARYFRVAEEDVRGTVSATAAFSVTLN